MKLLIAAVVALFAGIVIFVWIASELADPKVLPQPANWNDPVIRAPHPKAEE